MSIVLGERFVVSASGIGVDLHALKGRGHDSRSRQARVDQGRRRHQLTHHLHEGEAQMKTNHRLIVVSMFMFTSLAWPAHAADRMRAGQWVGTTITGGKTFPTSSCVSPSEAAGMNGDATAVKAYLETIIPPQICKISDVKANANQVIYTASCTGGGGVKTVKTVTTSYHGDHSEGTDTTGSKTEAKLVGACK
jgi:hypothetical protein